MPDSPKNRVQTPLQVLARNHNWQMGSLCRDRANINNWQSNSARIAALNALDHEIKMRKKQFDEDRTALKQWMIDHPEGTI